MSAPLERLGGIGGNGLVVHQRVTVGDEQGLARLIVLDIAVHGVALAPAHIGRIAHDDIITGWRLWRQHVALEESHPDLERGGIGAGHLQGIARDVQRVDLCKLQRPGQRDGDAAAPRAHVEHAEVRLRVLVDNQVHELLGLGARN